MSPAQRFAGTPTIIIITVNIYKMGNFVFMGLPPIEGETPLWLGPEGRIEAKAPLPGSFETTIH